MSAAVMSPRKPSAPVRVSTTPLHMPPSAYGKRRKQLMRLAGDDAIIVIPAAPERIRSRDTHYPYRQDSDLLYLTGFGEPEAVLVLAPGRRCGAASPLPVMRANTVQKSRRRLRGGLFLLCSE